MLVVQHVFQAVSAAAGNRHKNKEKAAVLAAQKILQGAPFVTWEKINREINVFKLLGMQTVQ